VGRGMWPGGRDNGRSAAGAGPGRGAAGEAVLHQHQSRRKLTNARYVAPSASSLVTVLPELAEICHYDEYV